MHCHLKISSLLSVVRGIYLLTSNAVSSQYLRPAEIFNDSCNSEATGDDIIEVAISTAGPVVDSIIAKNQKQLKNIKHKKKYTPKNE